VPERQGEFIAHYQLIKKIGEGGMGVVWKALDTRLGREVALKFLPDELARDAGRVSRFEREARTLASLKHPNIVTIYSVEEDRGTRFLTMELVDGTPLNELILAGGAPIENIFEIGIPLSAALAAAHEKGVVHRDLKPANVMVDEQGNLKVLDFGLAKLKPASLDTTAVDAATETVTSVGQVLGTFPYMSPEQVHGSQVDHRSDIFSLGIMLHELATGSRPFHGKTLPGLVSSILKDVPVSVTSIRGDLPEHIGRVIRRCLEKDPNRRYQSALDVRNELEDLRGELESGQLRNSPSAPAEPPPRPPRRWWVPVGIVALIAVVSLAVAWTFGLLGGRSARESTPEIRSLAVLPFENLMGDPSQDYFVEGMHDALIAELAKTGLKVISRTSVMRYGRRSDKRLPQIAQELGVDALIEGSVLRVGDNVRVTAQLIDGVTDQHLWADSYDDNLGNAMAMLAEATRSIAAQVRVALTPQQHQRLGDVRPVNPEAQDACFRGRYFLNRFNVDDNAKSIAFFKKAIDIDPHYAPGFAGLAYAQALDTILGQGSRVPETARSFRAAAEKAVALDPQLAEGHAMLGLSLLYFDWDWLGAEKELKLALELNPADALIYHPYGDSLLVQGRLEESLAVVKEGAELDPLSPLVVGPVGGHLNFLRRYDEAIEFARRFQIKFPDSAFGGALLRSAFWHTDRYEEALAYYRDAWRGDAVLLQALENGYAKAGPRGAMRGAADLLAARSKSGYVRPIETAKYYAMAGDADPAFEWLERAYRERSPFLAHLKVDPDYDALYSDPRFDDLLRRMNFPE
jgi:serine/threonine protein kinase/tetratricopeptide (TPR) repeat protein